jgi:predicted signal transduction protein with EAL and GGDEF domain
VTHDPRAEPEQLVRNADAAMYEAKKAGRNRFRVYDHKLAYGTCSPSAGDASTA